MNVRTENRIANIEESLVDISQALNSLNRTVKRIEARERGIRISGRYSWNNKTPYDWSKEEDL